MNDIFLSCNRSASHVFFPYIHKYMQDRRKVFFVYVWEGGNDNEVKTRPALDSLFQPASVFFLYSSTTKIGFIPFLKFFFSSFSENICIEEAHQRYKFFFYPLDKWDWRIKSRKGTKHEGKNPARTNVVSAWAYSAKIKSSANVDQKIPIK